MALGPTQLRVLDVLAHHGPGLVWQIAARCGRAVSEDAARSSLRSLKSRELVRLSGHRGGARCWAITPAGRNALTEEVDQ